MTTAIGLLILTVASVMLCLIQAFTMSTIWGWFIAPQYGTGPTFAAWYGVSVIVGLMLYAATHRIATTKDERPIADAFARVVGLGVGYMLALGFAWLVGKALGWL